MKSKLQFSFDPFNTEIFEKVFSNITSYDPKITSMEIDKLLSENKSQMYGIKIDSNDKDAIYNFQKSGFYVIDVLVTYEYEIDHSKNYEDNFGINYKEVFSTEDINKVALIASKVFKFDRFHSDPNIEDEKVNTYYYKWVINSFKGFSDDVTVGFLVDEPIGFITYKINNIDNETSTIVLNAVDSKYGNRGVYQSMVNRTITKLNKFSKRIRIGTQVNNLPVHRVWQKLGAKIISVKYVLHKIVY